MAVIRMIDEFGGMSWPHSSWMESAGPNCVGSVVRLLCQPSTVHTVEASTHDDGRPSLCRLFAVRSVTGVSGHDGWSR